MKKYQNHLKKKKNTNKIIENKGKLRPVIIGFTILLVVIASIWIFNVISGSSLVSDKKMTIANEWNLILDAKNPNNKAYVKRYYENVTFTLHEQVRKGDGTGTAKVTVTTPDMRIVLKEVLDSLKDASNQTEQELAEQAQNKIDERISQEHQIITTNIEVPIKRVDGKWKIVPTEEWNKVITSNMAEIFREYYAEILREDLE
jgi:hypothetical protein